MNTHARPARVVSPGVILDRELEARGWTQRDLATIIGRPYQAINEIIKGTKQITPDTARELARAFGTSIDFWMNLEANYRLHMAQQNEKEEEIVRKSHVYSIAPIRKLIKRGWIKGSDSIEELEQQIKDFFAVADLDADKLLGLPVNFRFSKNREAEAAAQAAWVRRAEILASEPAIPEFSRQKLEKALPALFELTTDAQLIARVPEILASAGVYFLVLPHLPKTYLDGAAILRDGHPIVALTLRYDRIDSFWFTLFHEVAHIYLGHRGVLVDNTETSQGSGHDAQENEANRLATQWMIDQKRLSRFINEVKPYFSKADVLEFAMKADRHPGIVVGQLHNRKVMGFQNLRELLVKVSPYLQKWIYN